MNEKRCCPYCGKEIMAAAKKCRFCGKWLTADNAPVNNTSEGIPTVTQTPQENVVVRYNTTETTQENTSQTRACPYCGEEILASAKKCKHCGSWLSEYAKYSYEKKNNISSGSSAAVSKDAISKGIQDAMEAKKEAEEDQKEEKDTDVFSG
jgi:predicted RNA-binding Zn-ribbon protein involved in translation (DUF1610 family)